MRGAADYASYFGASGDVPANYSLSPQFSVFAPLGASGWFAGGSFSTTRVADRGLANTPDFDMAGPNLRLSMLHTTGDSTGNFYSGSLTVARRLGRAGLGLSVDKMRSSGSMSGVTTDTDIQGSISTELVASSSRVSQTRLTW